MKKKFGIITILISCAISVLVTVITGVVILSFKSGSIKNVDNVLKYADVLRIIDNGYIGEADMDLVEDQAYRTMISSLDDRWSYYMNAKEYESYQNYSNNSYSGIGITIQQDPDTTEIVITAVTDDGPASKAGIKAGDILLSVEGTQVAGFTTSEVRELIQNNMNSEFTVEIRSSENEVREVTLKGEVIYTKPVSYEMLEGNVGYIEVKNFESGSAEAVIESVNKLMADDAKGIIFDMRDNPGGKVSQLLEMLDYLLPEGDIFVSVNKNGKETVHTSDSDCIELPMVVLVNGNTYSAAEFFAAALREYNWATVVGEQTTGKGRSQITVGLSDGSAVHISTNVYLTPNRVDLSKVGGITPDVELENSETEDLQLNAAINAIT